MSEIDNFSIGIVGRTKKLLTENYNNFIPKNLEATFLINCLLGLVVAVSENKKSTKIFESNIDSEWLNFIPNEIGFLIREKEENKIDLTESLITNFSIHVGHKSDLVECRKDWFIKKIRNGISHVNVEGVNNNGLWVGVRIWNINNGVKDFEIVLMNNELKKLANKIAEDYLKDNSLG